MARCDQRKGSAERQYRIAAPPPAATLAAASDYARLYQLLTGASLTCCPVCEGGPLRRTSLFPALQDHTLMPAVVPRLGGLVQPILSAVFASLQPCLTHT